MERHHSFFLNWYKPADATPVTIWPTDGNVIAPFLSTVDNAWLAVGLIMVKNADPGLKAQAEALLDSMNWGFFYDHSKGHLYGGYTVSGVRNTSPETKITLSGSGAALDDLQTASTLSLQVYVPTGTTLTPNSYFVGLADTTTGGGFNWVDGTFAGQTLHPGWNAVTLGIPQAWKTLNPAQTYTLYFSFFNETAGVKTPLQSGFNLGAATLDTPAGPAAFSLWNSATAASFGNDNTGAVVTPDPGVLKPGGQTSVLIAPVSAGQYTDFAYGALNTEPRIASYLGLARGQLPRERHYKLYRTFPADWEQEQTPTGMTRTYEGVNVYEGVYSYGGVTMVPSWGGNMFEALMVPEFVPEAEWAPNSWGKNHDNHMKAQIFHGLKDAR